LWRKAFKFLGGDRRLLRNITEAIAIFFQQRLSLFFSQFFLQGDRFSLMLS
jgi:hypothetical protein